jgi:hypothetical protein
MYKRLDVKPITCRVSPEYKYPHCDARILHAPGECTVCDDCPQLQSIRLTWGIVFTGYLPEGHELPDPATHARGEKSINSWHGNVPQPSKVTMVEHAL